LNSYGIAGIELMRRAGGVVFELLKTHFCKTAYRGFFVALVIMREMAMWWQNWLCRQGSSLRFII
jgi:hypothetical protein